MNPTTNRAVSAAGATSTIVAAERPSVELIEVGKRFGPPDIGVEALHGVTLAVAPGEFVAVMGPSGSGKSTLLQVACGLVSPTVGTVRIDGDDVPPSSPRWPELRRRRIGVVFQRLNLLPELTALENVMAPLLLDGRRIAVARELAAEAMAELDIEQLRSVLPDDLSGGQQQRVAIARAIVGGRGILLADEPTGALDSVTADDVARLLAARADAGVAVVVATHDASVASWADRVVLLRDGAVLGTAESVEPTAWRRP